jgi:putative DNA primase/helicase
LRREAKERKRHEAVSSKAQEIWSRAAPAMLHEYLRRKRVLPLGVRQKDDLLVIPMTEPGRDEILNVQTISAAGKKLFLRGGRVSGLAYRIAPNERTRHPEIYVAEGFATAATWHMYLRAGAEIYVAFNAGNLKPVVQAIHEAEPDREIVVVADNDCWTDGNPGLTKGREAAAAVGARLLYPKFSRIDTSTRPTDFNDLWVLQRRERGHG